MPAENRIDYYSDPSCIPWPTSVGPEQLDHVQRYRLTGESLTASIARVLIDESNTLEAVLEPKADPDDILPPSRVSECFSGYGQFAWSIRSLELYKKEGKLSELTKPGSSIGMGNLVLETAYLQYDAGIITSERLREIERNVQRQYMRRRLANKLLARTLESGTPRQLADLLKHIEMGKWRDLPGNRPYRQGTERAHQRFLQLLDAANHVPKDATI